MTVSSTKFQDAVKHQVIVDTGVTTASLGVNVSEGPGRLFLARADNIKDQSNPVYLKIYDVVGPVLGTTYPCLVLKVAAGTSTTFHFPYGLEFDSLSFGITSDANPISTNNPNTSTGVYLTCS